MPGSPFAVPPAGSNPAPSQPISISAEPSGKFLFVGFFKGDLPGNSAVVSLSINTSGSSPALVPIQSTDILGAPIQLLIDPTAGQSAQYQLQLTPGSGYAGTVSLSCSGAPLGAVCQVPLSVSLASGAATFNVTVTTSGPAQLPPTAPLRIPPISHGPLFVPILLALFLLAFLRKNRQALQPAVLKNRLLRCGVLYAGIFCVPFAVAGCGGGSSASVTPPPPQIVTPSGTSTITISLSANSSSGQPLQLQPIQLTLTVK